MASINRVPAFIVGGGPVGLALAVALDRFGIRSLVAERSATTTDHPKSRGCWVRTMEIFRQWGVEDAIRARGLADGTDVFAMMERLTGREYGRTRPEPRGDQSPTWKSMVAQDAVEERWMDAARTETTLDWFDQQFVLVTGTEGAAWLEAGADVARRLRVPLGLKSWPASHEAALDIGCGMGRRGAVLVRPDGRVAWRMAWCPPDPKAELASAMATLLAGTVADHPAMAWR